jgi:hypothetical protein
VTSITTIPSTFAPGATVTVRVKIMGSLANGGLWLSHNGTGAFAVVAGQNTRLTNTDIVHSAPKAAANGVVTFDVNWTAPSTPGGVIFNAATVMGNGSGSGGDQSGSAQYSLAFGCAGQTFYRDFDGDGVGALSSGTFIHCAAPSGYSALSGDCDDNDQNRSPQKNEICNGVDDNCNNQIDEGLATATTWPDMDSDGYGAFLGVAMTGCIGAKRVANNTDCDDTSASIFPMAMEVCNLKDDNCNGQIDENAKARCGVGWCARLSPTCNATDCTPGPPANERCNGLDEDCNGVVDDGLNLCTGAATCINARCVDDSMDASIPFDAGSRTDSGINFPPDAGMNVNDSGVYADSGIRDAGFSPSQPNVSCGCQGTTLNGFALSAILLSLLHFKRRYCAHL